MKNKSFVALSVSLFLSGCITGKRTEIHDESLLLPQQDRVVLNAAIQLQQRLADRIWPKLSQFRATVIFLSEKGQFLFNAKEKVPQEYEPITSQGIFWSTEDYKTKAPHNADGKPFTQQEYDQGYFANAYSSAETEGHFSHSIFFVDSIQRFRLKGTTWSPDDWLSIFWHEQFHNFQDTLYKPELVGRDVTSYSNIRAYVESEDFLNKIRAEQRTVMEALQSSQPTQKRKLMCKQFMESRTSRYREMKPTAVKAEQFYELSEGSARYVEELMSLEAANLFSEVNERKNFKIDDFEYFAKYATKDVTRYYATLDRVSPSMRYYYNTGFALALFLDQVGLSWKESVFKTEGFLFSKLQQWCV